MADKGIKTQGLGTFNTEYSADNFEFEDNPTEIDFKEYLIFLLKVLATKIPYTSDFYFRVVETLPTVTTIDASHWNENDVVFEKSTRKFFKLVDKETAEFKELEVSGSGFKLIDETTSPETKYNLSLKIKADGKCHLEAKKKE